MIYLKTILDRHDEEIIKKVYIAMRENPLKNDWYHLVKTNFEKVNLTLDEQKILEANMVQYKCEMKKAVWKYFFKVLQERKTVILK